MSKIDRQLLCFIQEHKKIGTSDELIEEKLIKRGWKKEKVDEALAGYKSGKRTKLSKFWLYIDDICFFVTFALAAAFIVVLTILVVEDIEREKIRGNRSAKNAMSNIRSQANFEINLNDPDIANYHLVCGSNGAEQAETIKKLLKATEYHLKEPSIVCNSMESAYAISVNLNPPERNNFFCIDSSGNVGEYTKPLANDDYQCPEKEDKK